MMFGAKPYVSPKDGTCFEKIFAQEEGHIMPVGFAKLIHLVFQNLFIDSLFQRLNPIEFIIQFAEFN